MGRAPGAGRGGVMFALELITFILSAVIVLSLFAAAVAYESWPLVPVGVFAFVATFILQPVIYEHFDDLRASVGHVQTRTCEDKGGVTVDGHCLKKNVLVR